MIVSMSPSPLSGEILCPASKSVAHRALIAAALSDAPTTLTGRLEGDDVLRKRAFASENKAYLLFADTIESMLPRE